jgi:hypothetical protein
MRGGQTLEDMEVIGESLSLPSYITLKLRVRRWGYSDEAARVTGRLKLGNMNFFN